MKSSAQGFGQLATEGHYMANEGPTPFRAFFVPCFEKL
jgi:hypothetical protein